MDLQRPFKGGWASLASSATAPPPVIASIDAGTVRQRFNWEWAVDPDNGFETDTYWWWARSIRLDPNEVIADDDEGNLWSVPFTTDGLDAVTFGTPVRVAETFVPVTAGEGAAATAVVQRRRQRVIATALEQPTKPDRTTNQAAAASAPANERNPMDAAVLQALARQHGLDPDTATEDQVNAAVIAANTPDPEGDPAGGTLDTPETPAVTPEPELVAATVPTDLRELLGLPASASETDVVTAARALREGSDAGARVARQAQAAELDREVDAAVSDGRIMPSARDAWRQAVDPGEHPSAAATSAARAERDALAAMATNRVPVTERGTASTSEQNGGRPASLTRVLASTRSQNRRLGGAPQEVNRRG